MASPLEEQFAHDYSKVLVQTWTDREFKARLEKEPAQVLKEYGIPTAKNAKINIVKEVQPGQASLATQMQEWVKGAETGNYTLYLPEQPQLSTESAAGVGDFGVSDVSVCCCCCPCCCCT